MAEPSDMEVIGVHTIEGLGLAADPVRKKLIPRVMPALTARQILKGRPRSLARS